MLNRLQIALGSLTIVAMIKVHRFPEVFLSFSQFSEAMKTFKEDSFVRSVNFKTQTFKFFELRDYMQSKGRSVISRRFASSSIT